MSTASTGPRAPGDEYSLPEAVCPVCWGPAPVVGACRTCAWPPADPGPTAYRDAARAFDHAAVLRVASARGLTEVPRALADLVRFGPVVVEAPSAAVEPVPGTGRAAALTLLTALTAGELDLVLFVDIGTRYLAAQWVTLDERGFVSAPSANRTRHDWREVVPWLPEDDAARDLTLAGGVGRRPAVGTAEAPEALAARARSTLRRNWADTSGWRALPDHPWERAWALVLVERRPAWAWCALATEVVREQLPPAAVLGGGCLEDESIELPALIELLALDVPARHPLHLVGVDPGPGDATRDHPTVLLDRGATPGAADGPPLAEITLGLRGEGPDGHDVAVAVADTADPAEWSELERITVFAPPGEVRLTVRMIGPGRVDITPSGGAAWVLGAGRTDVRPAGRPTTVAALPRPFWQPAPPTAHDLLCVVELGGTPEQTAARLALVRALLAEAARADRSTRWEQAAVLGYDDHPRPRRSRHDPLRRVDFAPPDTTRAAIADWVGTPAVDPYAAPLERVCALLRTDPLGRRTSRHTLVVTVGLRGPHPYVQGLDPAQAYGGGRWDADLTARRAARPGDRHLLVTDDPGYPGAADPRVHDRTLKAWRLLGADGCFTLDRTTPADLLRFGHAALTGTTGAPLLLDVNTGPSAAESGGKGVRR
ncbi:hypothetical protein [Embleya hyalina]|uniref:Uncharacterized protein n=1 Tax=Embleya hyalina TaxID=516124 RepID=A0A401YW39_9ACTN|nr:hypothetical protein [Embleya hyalina]GCD98790.1 hypothetical protein EHYA_06501 [Embleya hyalina]